MEYFVETKVFGRVAISVTSLGDYGTGVAYSGSVVMGNGSVQMAGDMLNVSGLDYIQSHTLSIVVTSNMCSGLQRRNLLILFFNTSGNSTQYNYE